MGFHIADADLFERQRESGSTAHTRETVLAAADDFRAAERELAGAYEAARAAIAPFIWGSGIGEYQWRREEAFPYAEVARPATAEALRDGLVALGERYFPPMQNGERGERYPIAKWTATARAYRKAAAKLAKLTAAVVDTAAAA